MDLVVRNLGEIHFGQLFQNGVSGPQWIPGLRRSLKRSTRGLFKTVFHPEIRPLVAEL